MTTQWNELYGNNVTVVDPNKAEALDVIRALGAKSMSVGLSPTEEGEYQKAKAIYYGYYKTPKWEEEKAVGGHSVIYNEKKIGEYPDTEQIKGDSPKVEDKAPVVRAKSVGLGGIALVVIIAIGVLLIGARK